MVDMPYNQTIFKIEQLFNKKKVKRFGNFFDLILEYYILQMSSLFSFTEIYLNCNRILFHSIKDKINTNFLKINADLNVLLKIARLCF